jgi:phage-related protein
MSRLSLLILVLGALALAAGCGSDKSSGTVSTTDWANSLCSAVTTWTSSVKSAGDSLKGGNVSQDALKSAADDVTSATDTFADDLRGLGKPDTEAGQQAKASVQKLSDELKSDLQDIKSTVDEASGVSGTLNAVTAASGKVSAMGTQVQSTFSDLEQLDAKGELENAFQQADACSSLTKS